VLLDGSVRILQANAFQLCLYYCILLANGTFTSHEASTSILIVGEGTYIDSSGVRTYRGSDSVFGLLLNGRSPIA
jgi:hypothetical protein